MKSKQDKENRKGIYMGDRKETTVLACTFVGGIADVIAIVAAIMTREVSLAFFAVALLLLIGSIAYLYTELKERKDFIGFVEYLFNNSEHSFTLLPKICLTIDRNKEINSLHVRNLTIKYTCDFQRVNLDGIEEDSPICYDDVVEYSYNIENKDIPEEFVCYMGNIYADGPIELSQKHGSQQVYELVPLPRFPGKPRAESVVQRYSWQLKREHITHNPIFPVSFRLKYHEKNIAKSSCTIVFYPKQHAELIDNVVFEVDFRCVKNVLQKVELFKVCSDGGKYKHIPISGVTISDNSAKISVHPGVEKMEVYYLKVSWNLV